MASGNRGLALAEISDLEVKDALHYSLQTAYLGVASGDRGSWSSCSWYDSGVKVLFLAKGTELSCLMY